MVLMTDNLTCLSLCQDDAFLNKNQFVATLVKLKYSKIIENYVNSNTFTKQVIFK